MKTYQNVLPNGVRVIGLDHSQNEYIRDKDFFALLRKYCGEDAIEMILEKRKSLCPGWNSTFSPPTYWIKVRKDGKKEYPEIVTDKPFGAGPFGGLLADELLRSPCPAEHGELIVRPISRGSRQGRKPLPSTFRVLLPKGGLTPTYLVGDRPNE